MNHSPGGDPQGQADSARMAADPADVPILSAQLPPAALATLRRQLTDHLGWSVCEQILRAVDGELGQLAAWHADCGADADSTRSLDDARAVLAGKRGLAWQVWAPGRYLVALDGTLIGNVEEDTVSGTYAARVAGAIGVLPHPFESVAGAAAALRLHGERTDQRT